MKIILVALALFASASSPLGSETIRLDIERKIVDPCPDGDLLGTELIVGGAAVSHLKHRVKNLKGEWSPWFSWVAPFHETESDGLIHYDTKITIVYADDLEPLEVLSSVTDGGRVVATIANPRRSRNIRIYVGDTSDFVRLDCMVDGGRAVCNSYKEV